MAKTMAIAKASFANKLRVMPTNYNEGMSKFFGQNVSQAPPCRAYAGAMTASVIEKWERNLKASFGL